MDEADNLAAAGDVIRRRTQILPIPATPLSSRIVFYIPIPKGEELLAPLKAWLEGRFGGGTAAPHGITPATGVWRGEQDELVLVYAFSDMRTIQKHQDKLFQKAREMLGQLQGEKCLGVEIGAVLYFVYPEPERDRVRNATDLATFGSEHKGGEARARKWPADVPTTD